MCFVMTWCAMSIVTAQQSPVVWDVPNTVTLADRLAILDLASRLGIPDPARISGSRGDSAPVRVEARATVRGRDVNSAFVEFHRRGPGCGTFEERMPQMGRWVSLAERSKPIERWRIRDGDWFVDVNRSPLGYEFVERIVLITRSMGWVERCAVEHRTPHTASDILIVAPAPLPLDPEFGTHWVSTQRRPPGALLGEHQGLMVIVAVDGPDVQFVRCSTWVT
jgi:hypothetical protein